MHRDGTSCPNIGGCDGEKNASRKHHFVGVPIIYIRATLNNMGVSGKHETHPSVFTRTHLGSCGHLGRTTWTFTSCDTVHKNGTCAFRLLVEYSGATSQHSCLHRPSFGQQTLRKQAVHTDATTYFLLHKCARARPLKEQCCVH